MCNPLGTNIAGCKTSTKRLFFISKSKKLRKLKFTHRSAQMYKLKFGC